MVIVVNSLSFDSLLSRLVGIPIGTRPRGGTYVQIIFQVVLVLRFQTPPSLLPAILVYPQLRIGKTRGVDDRILAASHREWSGNQFSD